MLSAKEDRSRLTGVSHLARESLGASEVISGPTGKRFHGGLGVLRACLLAILLFVANEQILAAEGSSEERVKAIFVYNFSHFVTWPPNAGPPESPFVIGVLGSDELSASLEAAVRGESVDQHPLVVRRLRPTDDIGDCQILYIDRAEAGQLTRVLATLDHRSTLTVSDVEDAAARGVMIQLVTESAHIRLRINVDSARTAGLTISSNLLRPSQIVSGQAGG